MTDSGRVYHSNRMCSHIKLSIFMVDGQKARKYPPCEKCVGNAAIPGNTFYLTEDGACYHSRLSCSRLKRVYGASDSQRRFPPAICRVRGAAENKGGLYGDKTCVQFISRCVSGISRY